MANPTLLRQRGAYAIRCTDGRCYVGGSCDVRLRWLQHRSALRLGKHTNRSLQAAWSKCGEHAFEYVVLEIIGPDDDLLRAEQRWIDKLRAEGELFNTYITAGSPAGMKLSPEHREKISRAGRRRKHTPEQTAKIAAANRGNAHSAGERNRHAVIREAEIPSIRARLAAGETQRAIAAEYGVGATTISHIATRRNWSHVP